ncbi:glycine--tRNA ligase subunit beta, partial [Novosphingobium sp.]|uniref:glycine--tRNA ligase subunit beta n=1 Tax=Novosphingobium sp. TaxID=1874826 RepID=UPI0025DBFC9F
MSTNPTPFVSSEVETPGADFLLELRSEEIPARMQAGARADLEKLFRREMEAAGLAVGALTVWSTPRRLTLIAKGLPLATQAQAEETKGPRTSAPEQALEGFLRKTGLTKDQLAERDGVWFAVVEKPGRAAAEVLAAAIPAIIRAFPWPKSQRWGAASLAPDSLRWVRPLSGIIALLGGEVIDCEIGGIRSGRTTMGHRFHHSGEIVIDGVDDYAAKLREAHVIVDHAEREAIVREGAKQAAADADLLLVEDEGLVIENAGLTEWPVPLLGRFDEAFLEVPPEVIQLTARVNQKYFICRDAAGKLANAFVCTANIAAHDGGAMIVAGNRKVLAARLSDARFFWEQDRKTPLSVQAEKLARITFHEKLGTVADKVERVAKLARWLVEEGIVKPSPLQGRGLGEGAAGTTSARGGGPRPPPPPPGGQRGRRG